MAAQLPRSLPLPSTLVRTGGRSLLGTIGRLADPGIALLCLFGVHWLTGREIGTPAMLLGALAFSLSYPGDLPFLKQPRAVVRRIAAAWSLVSQRPLSWSCPNITFPAEKAFCCTSGSASGAS